MIGASETVRLLLVADPVPEAARRALEGSGFALTTLVFRGIDPTEVAQSQGVILYVTPRSLATAQALCRRWRIELGDHYVPFVWLAEDGVPAAAGLDAGADVVLPATVEATALAAQVRALVRIHFLHNRLADRAGEAQNINQRFQQLLQQIDSDAELTRRIHRAFLPASLPDFGSVRFGVCYRPRSRIGGDFYDVIRLDEDHVALYVADAMGRGLPASSLLSIFVKKCLRMKEITGRSYRLLPPGEVLESLNRELLRLSLAEPPFVTMLLMQINCRTGALTLARAAHPHPLYVPASDGPVYWHASGSLLGVLEGDFPMQTRQLQAGDKLILFSDGVHPPDQGPGSLRDPLVESAARHRSLSVQAFVDAVSRDLLRDSRHAEDFTLLAAEMT